MNRQEHYDIATWANEAPDAEQREFRQAVHTILAAIANDPRRGPGSEMGLNPNQPAAAGSCLSGNPAEDARGSRFPA